ncbi:MAG TPA: hypothetical protein VF797_01540 [Noviherbaspirillum sp.]
MNSRRNQLCWACWLAEFLVSVAVALGLLLVLCWLIPGWRPGLLASFVAMAVASANVRFLLLLGDTGPGPDINGMFLNVSTFVGAAANPLRWRLWPVATYQRATWPRTVTIKWLFLLIQWEYSPDLAGDDPDAGRNTGM